MEDTRVTFETAKLAKEKLFPQSRKAKGKFRDDGSTENLGIGGAMVDTCKEWYERPTQSVLQKWLREVHNIHFEIKPIFDVKDNLKPYHISVIKNPSGKDFEYEIVGSLDTYEEALEIGLQKALKLINIIK